MSKVTTFVQWKGTDLCMDLYCPQCGERSHFDGAFAYVIQCPHCKSYFRMPINLAIEKVDDPNGQPVLVGQR